MIAPLQDIQSLELFELTGGRWTVSVLATLGDGTLRFGQIQRSLRGISHKQLAHTLRHLERNGFVQRTAYLPIPPRVDYQLTELGQELTVLSLRISRFASERGSDISMAQKRFDDAPVNFRNLTA